MAEFFKLTRMDAKAQLVTLQIRLQIREEDRLYRQLIIHLYAFLDALLRVLEASRAQLAPTRRPIRHYTGECPRRVARTVCSYKKRLLSITENLIKHISNIYVKI